HRRPVRPQPLWRGPRPVGGTGIPDLVVHDGIAGFKRTGPRPETGPQSAGLARDRSRDHPGGDRGLLRQHDPCSPDLPRPSGRFYILQSGESIPRAPPRDGALKHRLVESEPTRRPIAVAKRISSTLSEGDRLADSAISGPLEYKRSHRDILDRNSVGFE